MTQSRRNVITPTQHANPHQTDNADGRIQPQTDRTSTRVFKTILITDSILRHVKDVENALGVNHNLQVINKRSTWGLKDDEFRAILRREIPDFLYVHLGINDIHQNFDTKQSMENICSLILFMDKYLPDCKVFLSQPLLTGDSDTNHGVRKLRLSIKKFVTGIDTPGRLKDKQILLNENTNFSYNNAPISEYYSSDRIHLSQRGKTAILGNLRHHIHAVTRDILNKPSRLPPSSSADGNKFDDKEFIATINKHDFVCLQETRQEVHLAGFRSICNTRKDKKSGGVAILIRNELIEGVEVIKNIKNSEYLICRLDKNFFRLSQDIFIINVYVKPLNSSSSTQLENGRDTLKQIEDLVNDLKKDGDVALCGDFNARTGISPGLVSQDSTDHIPLPEDYDPDTSSPRNSLDSITNTYGKIFLDLIKNNQLTILNGRTLGDLTGNFTSIQKNGCSVIDYIAVSSNLKCDIKYFKVLPFTEYSDHRPISTELNIKQISVSQLTTLHETYEKAPSRFIFNEENKDMFCNIQGREASLNTVTNLNLKIKDILDMNGEEADIEKAVKEVNNNITEHMRNLAEECFKKTKPLKNGLTSKKPWFNWGTRLAKREFRKATTSTDMFPQSEFLRHNFYKVKSKYKKYVNKTRNKFFEDMNTDIENGKVLNWQAFKKLKQQKTNEKTFDSYDMKRFENFFSNLYSDNHKTVTADQKKAFLDEALDYNSTLQAPESLNNPIDDKEICLVIKSLKQGKASAKDMINNEILKSLNSNYRSLLQNLFNVCLTKGIYPWNCSIITPLHKKGDKANPDNYRAVAVSSVIVCTENLKTKAMRAFFGLKRAVIRSKLSFKALTILFDSLIKPIVLYGAPIWAPNSSTWSTIAKASDPLLHNQKNFLKTLGGSIQEKVHLSFLKWALGVHRKASNIGVWGESGRSPLFYESIRLSINYFKRLENLDSTCLVSAALREQKKLKLPWFTRMKSVLQLDETYSKDHVAAFHALNPKSKLIKRKPTCTASSFSPSKNSILVPIKSEKYRPWKIMESLSGTFKTNWEHQKSSSPKLSFYHKIKSSFGLEPYLESNNFKLRYSTTQFRISAHDLQVERGRYINLPRDKRICLWCKTTLNRDIIEDEPHILFDCDLYAGLRQKLIRNLNKIPSPTQDPSTTQTESMEVTSSNIRTTLMSFLSPNCVSTQLTTIIHPEHSPEIKHHQHTFNSLVSKRAYIISCICSYISRCFEERKKLSESARAFRSC
ncbi:hypothetical protein ACHWQZ_G008954 [Mnemiopsis leidyi]